MAEGPAWSLEDGDRNSFPLIEISAWITIQSLHIVQELGRNASSRGLLSELAVLLSVRLVACGRAAGGVGMWAQNRAQ